jgi:hypothetical protein
LPKLPAKAKTEELGSKLAATKLAASWQKGEKPNYISNPERWLSG